MVGWPGAAELTTRDPRSRRRGPSRGRPPGRRIPRRGPDARNRAGRAEQVVSPRSEARAPPSTSMEAARAVAATPTRIPPSRMAGHRTGAAAKVGRGGDPQKCGRREASSPSSRIAGLGTLTSPPHGRTLDGTAAAVHSSCGSATGRSKRLRSKHRTVQRAPATRRQCLRGPAHRRAVLGGEPELLRRGSDEPEGRRGRRAEGERSRRDLQHDRDAAAPWDPRGPGRGRSRPPERVARLRERRVPRRDGRGRSPAPRIGVVAVCVRRRRPDRGVALARGRPVGRCPRRSDRPRPSRTPQGGAGDRPRQARGGRAASSPGPGRTRSGTVRPVSSKVRIPGMQPGRGVVRRDRRDLPSAPSPPSSAIMEPTTPRAVASPCSGGAGIMETPSQ